MFVARAFARRQGRDARPRFNSPLPLLLELDELEAIRLRRQRQVATQSEAVEETGVRPPIFRFFKSESFTLISTGLQPGDQRPWEA